MYIKPDSDLAHLVAYRVNDIVNENPLAYVSPQGGPDCIGTHVYALSEDELSDYINRGGEMTYIPAALWIDEFELWSKS